MKVSEIMRPARTIALESSVREAAQLMNKHSIGSLVVVNEDEKLIAGIITERDILSKVTAQNKLASKVRVRDVMTSKVITVSSDALIDDAVYLLIQHKIKKLPVVDDNELKGIITSTDLITNSEEIGQFYIFD
jgi:CBS domain-containing protein